jgi:peptidoglycan/LPS O-acetylase OafA/YrhL
MTGGHIPQIDGLRAVAIMAVLVHHWFPSKWGLGGSGVMLFFVISGYLITKSILQLKDAGLPTGAAARQFFTRRALRLMPAFFLTLAIGAAMFADVRRDWLWHAAYLSNFLIVVRGELPHLAAMWTLAVEEQFYLLWFFAAMLLPGRRLVVLGALAVAAAPALRCMHEAGGQPYHHLLLWANADALLLGAGLVALERTGQSLPRLGWLALPAALAMMALPRVLGFGAAIGSLLFALGAASLVWLARDGFDGLAGRILAHPWVVHVGKVSYGIYLYDMVVDPAAMSRLIPGAWRVLQPGTAIGFVVYCAIVIGVASLSYRYFEAPIRFMRRSPRAAAA